ncbi:16S rRNA (guanine(527)-N(7))-methyltransferase RsmG [Desulforamulus aeronauticus]|nr:16S rRNA (guanine(527)-N(7))-methyltransferase RsmG [Desulforamulus aeronauticus]
MSELTRILQQAGEQAGFSFSEKQIVLFEQYFDLLVKGNEKINLTSLTDPQEVAIKHFIDSLTCLTALTLPVGSQVLDVGTGAGFPGIPLKIYRNDLKITLMDSLQKRVNFLNETLQDLGLQDSRAIHDRAEDFAQRKEQRESYDLVVSRAVARLAVLAEYCLPCVKIGGYFISQKGPTIEDEVRESTKALVILGGEIEEVKKLSLPVIQDGRSIVVIKKISPTPKQYPRKAGMPAKKPLL